MSDVTPKPRKKRQAAPRWGHSALDGDEQHRLRREALFRTAAQAFNELGYHATTLDEVARRLNVTKPALYYYVKDKDDILFECNRVAFEHMRAALDEVACGPQNGLSKLTDFLTRYAELMATDFGACLIRTGLHPLRADSRAKLSDGAHQLNDALRSIVTQGVTDGSIRPCDPKMVSNALYGSFNAIAQWFQADGELTPAEIAAAYLDVFLNGLQPR